ncbi:MAG: TIGR01777 family oxidoreductase [Verrucomicrobiota bacterium]
MTIGILGLRGYIGLRLAQLAEADGHRVVPFSRRPAAGYREVSPGRPLDFSGLDAVVNLAGEPILGLWTASKKEEILRSRVDTTRSVDESLQSGGPRVLVNASAIGFYGDTGEREVDETSPAGEGFLAEVCQAWENAALPAEARGVRLVRLRIGFVTGPGGAMKLLRPLFKCFLGGQLGNGRQWMSWIHVDDVAGMILWALKNENVRGPLNAVSPEPIRNSQFTRDVARAFHRPAILPVPAFALRLALGELSHLLLDSARVRPAKAIELGYRYRRPSLVRGLRGSLE